MDPPHPRTPRLRAALVVSILALVVVPLLWVWPQRGLTATYHANTDWHGEPVATRVETRLTTEAVEEDPALPQQQFSMLMVGWLRVDDPGEYVFSTRSDDGSTLDVAGRRVVDNGGYHAARTASGRVSLARGFHPIRLRYIQGAGTYSLSVRWMPPGGAESAIPPTVLYTAAPPIPGLAWLGRQAGMLWAGAWAMLTLLVGARIATRVRDPGSLRAMALRGLAAAASAVVALTAIELAMRVARYGGEDRRPLAERLTEGGASGAGPARVFSLGDIVQPSPHAGIVYELKPNLRGVFADQPLATNSRGLRDREYDYAKPAGTVRIVALGDSSLFGWGVKREDTATEVLERMLNSAPGVPPTDVINFATPGYNTAIQADVFVEKALRYAPDVVLVNFNTNDYDVPAFMKVPPRDYATLRTSLLFDFLRSEYEAWTALPRRELPLFDFATRTLTLEEADRLDQDPGLPDEYRYMVGVRGFERAMAKIVAAAGDRRAEVVVFDARPFPGLHATYAPNAFRDSQRDLLERLSQELGFHWLNTYRYFVDYLEANPEARFPRVFAVSDTDSHPSVLAHRLSGQALYDYLVEKRLLFSR